MRNYQILLNGVYLYYKAQKKSKEDRINISELKKELHLTRNTINKLYDEFLQYNGLDYDIKNFYFNESNRVLRAIKIIEDLEGRTFNPYEYSKMLNLSSATIYRNLTLKAAEVPGVILYIFEEKVAAIEYVKDINNVEEVTGLQKVVFKTDINEAEGNKLVAELLRLQKGGE